MEIFEVQEYTDESPKILNLLLLGHKIQSFKRKIKIFLTAAVERLPMHCIVLLMYWSQTDENLLEIALFLGIFVCEILNIAIFNIFKIHKRQI